MSRRIVWALYCGVMNVGGLILMNKGEWFGGVMFAVGIVGAAGLTRWLFEVTP